MHEQIVASTVCACVESSNRGGKLKWINSCASRCGAQAIGAKPVSTEKLLGVVNLLMGILIKCSIYCYLR